MRVLRSSARLRPGRLTATALLSAIAFTGLAPAADAAKKPTSTKAVSGSVTAVVNYRLVKSYDRYRDLRLTVTGPTGKLTKARLPNIKSRSYSRPRITLADLNADGVVDVIVDTFSGGAHCCSTSSIALSTATGWAAPVSQFWGNYGYVLKEIGGAPGIELVSHDDRFAYAFSAYAASFPAIQIVGVRGGALKDVTREYPDAIREDLTEKTQLLDEIIADAKKEEYPNDVVQSAGAAVIADFLLLGDLEGAKGVLAKLDAGGFLKGAFADSEIPFTETLVKSFVEWGYLTSGSQIGL